MSLHQKIAAVAEQADLDAVVAMSPENFGYVSEAFVLTVELLRPRLAFAVVPLRADPFIVACSIERSLIAEESWIGDIVTYTEFKDHPIDVLATALAERGLSRGRIGIDLAYLPQTSYERLVARLPDITFVDTTAAIGAVRAVKSDDEVSRMEFAAKSTHRAVLDAMAASHLGDTEQAMANRISSGIIAGGADTNLFMCFASGPRTPSAHALPTDRVPQESEIIRFDVGGRYHMWASDFARTYSAGNPTATQRDMYRNLWQVEAETIAMMRPGVTAEDVFHACREGFESRGMAFHMPHIGHSFGIELHEDPMLRPGDKTVLKAGMVFNVEPFGFDGDGTAYHLEDLLVLTDNGSRILTHGLAPKEIPVIGETIEY